MKKRKSIFHWTTPLTVNIPQRLHNHCSFRRKTNDISTLPAKLKHRQLIDHFSSTPWQFSTPHNKYIRTFGPKISGRADNTTSISQYSVRYITSYQPNHESMILPLKEQGIEVLQYLSLEELPHSLKC